MNLTLIQFEEEKQKVKYTGPSWEKAASHIGKVLSQFNREQTVLPQVPSKSPPILEKFWEASLASIDVISYSKILDPLIKNYEFLV